LCSKGWCWGENAWAIDYVSAADHEGWVYCSNFESIDTAGSPVKALSHFVRRRRRIRKQIFVGKPRPPLPSLPSLLLC
jgi:hypothetical protein